MTNREIFNDLPNNQFLLAVREFSHFALFETFNDIQMWLNDPCDRYFWFDRLEILQLNEEKYLGYSKEEYYGQKSRTT